MQSNSFSKRQLAARAFMLDEEKNAALSDKRKRMWVHKCFRGRKSERIVWKKVMEGFLHIQNLGNI